MIKVLKTIFHSVAATINLCVLVLYLVSVFSPYLSPHVYRFVAYFGLAFPFFLVALMVLLFYWLLNRRFKAFILNFLILLLTYRTILTYIPMHFVDHPIPEGALKVLSYNVMAFGYKVNTPDSPNAVVRYINDSGADIVCLQEAALFPSPKYVNAKNLKKVFPTYPYHAALQYGSKDNHLLLLSKLPILKKRRVDYESSSNASMYCELQYGDKKIVLINNHLESFKLTSEDRKKYEQFVKGVSSERFSSLKGAVSRKLGKAFSNRAKQIEAVSREVQNAEADYTIVCGDFNDTPISYALYTMRKVLTDTYVKSGFGPGISYNRNLFWFRIDHILCSKGIEPIQCRVDRVPYSDHYPIYSYLLIP